MFLGTTCICAHYAHVDYGMLSRHLPRWQPAGVLDTLRLVKTIYPNLRHRFLDALIDHVKPDLSAAPH
ncbi:hypothetical protein [Streptomyces sp. NPDC017940]|uniref:hypothetical protein n=1 Tax=Streptomyces sp. NPDC017940 TaxID=3365017 RepID=UPI0037AACC09